VGLRFNVDVSSVVAAADRLDRFDSESLARVGRDAVNTVAERILQAAPGEIVQTINLTEAFVRKRMSLRRAEATANPEAVVVASGEFTRLAHYNPRIQLVPVKNPQRAKGNAALGIPAGLKQAPGVSVEVSRGAPKQIGNAFLLPLKNGNGVGVFTRLPGARKKQRYGPAVYQRFRAYAEDSQEENEDLLVETLTANAVAELERALG